MTARRATLAAIATLTVGAGAARAQQAPTQQAPAPACVPSHAPDSPETHAAAWPAPLDRRVSLAVHDVTLRAALDALATAARVRLSYSAELLPLDRCVRVTRRDAALGALLAELLDGVAAEALAVGRDEVVISPVRAAARRTSEDEPESRATVLDRVVVTGRAEEASQRSRTVAVDVISGAELARRGNGTLADALDASVPGLWAWTQSPASLTTRFGSLRGASEFGASYPKMYIDGIEVANPLLVTQLAPESVERVEVIRGPQGAALYGADAISGVVNIVMRHDGVHDGTPAFALRSRAGVAASAYADGPVPTQDHALTVHAGSGARTGTATVSATTVGEFVPGASSRQLAATGGLRLGGTRATFTSTGRLYAARAGVPAPSFVGEVGTVPLAGMSGDRAPMRGAGADEPQRVMEYTLGTRTTLATGSRWTHAAVIGLDGYRLSGLTDTGALVPYAADTAAQAAAAGGDRAVVRLSSVAQLVARHDASAALTLAAEHSALRERYAPDRAMGDGYYGPSGTSGGSMYRGIYGDVGGAEGGAATLSRVEWRNSTGVTAQLDGALRNALYVTGGVRVERDAALGAYGGGSLATLPMLGAALVGERGGVSAKLRAAYGTGIRSPRAVTRETLVAGSRAELASTLRPEQQSGVEAGVELVFGHALTLQATRFDQLASGLLQRVPLAPTVAEVPGTPPPHRLVYALENVGQITNRGWELQGDYDAGPLVLTGTLSLVDSRVRRLADGYEGDLRRGDRVLEVPARTAALTATWTGARWTAAATATRAADWVNYDRLAIIGAYAGSYDPRRELSGDALREYWRNYGGVTRVRASLARTLRPGLAATVAGENLLGQQRNEPDNATVLPGRTVTAGLRASF